MMIFIEQPDSVTLNEAANTLSEKLAEQAKEGAVIKLTPDEFELMRCAHVVGLGTKSSGEVELIEIKREASYIAVLSENVNIDDFVMVTKRSGARIHGIRFSS